MGARILVVDNYDSFVYTIVGYLLQLGRRVRRPPQRRRDGRGRRGVRRRAALTGPGTPSEAGVCPAMVRRCAEHVAADARRVPRPPGARARCSAATVTHAPELMHGKTSLVHHTGSGVLDGLASPVHRDPLPLAGRRVRDGARRARGHRLDRHRGRHGAAAPDAAAVTASSSTRSRCSPRAATVCSRTGWCAAARPTRSIVRPAWRPSSTADRCRCPGRRRPGRYSGRAVRTSGPTSPGPSWSSGCSRRRSSSGRRCSGPRRGSGPRRTPSRHPSRSRRSSDRSASRR